MPGEQPTLKDMDLHRERGELIGQHQKGGLGEIRKHAGLRLTHLLCDLAAIRVRWRYLRDLLIKQLGRFESGAMQMHAAGLDVSPDVVIRLKKEILEFDNMIAGSEVRDA
jgi:hypothetical protein